MNDRWDLEPIYKGFEDPAFEEDLKKLGNLVENTNDINNYETAQSRIKEEMNRLTPDRVSGSIRKNKNRITELSEVLRGSDAAEKAYLEKKQLLEEKQKEKERISKQRRICAGRLRSVSEADKKETLRQQYIKLEEDERNKKEAYLEKKKVFPQEIPQAEDLSHMQQKAIMRIIWKSKNIVQGTRILILRKKDMCLLGGIRMRITNKR